MAAILIREDQAGACQKVRTNAKEGNDGEIAGERHPSPSTALEFVATARKQEAETAEDESKDGYHEDLYRFYDCWAQRAHSNGLRQQSIEVSSPAGPIRPSTPGLPFCRLFRLLPV
jgi:hypothetical protein